jgi:hypothetical protein
VYPGGKLTTRNAYFEVEELVVDVMGILEADGQGDCGGGELKPAVCVLCAIIL